MVGVEKASALAAPRAIRSIAAMPDAEPTPAPFYESVRSYRNLKSAALFIVVPAFAFFPTWAMISGVPRGHYGGGSYVFATLLSLGFIAGFAKLFYNVVNNVREPARVDAEGVLLPSGQRIQWNQIAAMRFDRAPFSRRGYLACERSDQPSIFRSIRGQATLLPEDATAILQRIAAFAERAYPQVKVTLPRI
jgi:hypothetical protein